MTKIIRVDINSEMRTIARHWQLGLKGMYQSTYTNLYRKDSDYYGKLGELAFQSWLTMLSISFAADNTVRGTKDEGDVILDWDDGTKRVVDVKTALLPTHQNIMMPTVQRTKHGDKYDFFVGARVIDDTAIELFGWCTIDDFFEREMGFDDQKVPTLYRSLYNLRDLHELISHCARRFGE